MENPQIAHPSAIQTPAPPRRPSRGRILVMDDERTILDLTARMLGSQGFEVESAPSGTAALALYRSAMEAGKTFDAVILDLTMPEGMGGYDTFKALQKLNPAIKAIISSGYSHEPVVLNYKKYGLAGIAPKPYRVKDLTEAVDRVLRGE